MIREIMGCPTRLCLLLYLLLPACATNPDPRPICEVHGLALLDDEVPILYGYVVPRACDRDPSTPHVNDHALGGCRWYGRPESGPATVPAKYCPGCRHAIAHRPTQMHGPHTHWVSQVPRVIYLDLPEFESPPDDPAALKRFRPGIQERRIKR